MVDGTTVDARRLREALSSPHVPEPRSSLENAPQRRHRAPSLAELISMATMVIQRDSLAPTGYLVTEGRSGAEHQHSVWQLGPFALVDDGWFGQVQGNSSDDGTKGMRKHVRRCADQHWTQFRWIDPSQLEAGCGVANVGVGLSPDGPTYCPGHTFGETHPEHIPLLDIFTEGLRLLGPDQD